MSGALPVRRVSRFGWRPDLPDARDHAYAPAGAARPGSVDLRSLCPSVYDQGQLGSCTANAIAAAVQFERLRQGIDPDFVPSRLFIYFNERVIERTIPLDAGAQVRDGIKVVAAIGAPPEEDWPYYAQRFTERPPDYVFAAAALDRAVAYRRVAQDLDDLRDCLAEGSPIVFGCSVFPSFESDAVASSGEVPMPAVGEAPIGGHAMLIVGYDDAALRFLVRNSWGEGWGMAGYCTMPYAYLSDAGLAADFWTIRLLSPLPLPVPT